MDRSHLSQIAIGVAVGAVLGGTGVYLQFSSRITRVEARLDAFASVGGSAANASAAGAPIGPAGAQSGAIKPLSADSILALSADIQRAHVRESSGELKGENFSEDDFVAFLRNKIAQRAIDSLRHDARFLAIVLGLQAADAMQRQGLLRRAGQPIHRTWAECAKVSRDCQTAAGKRAEEALGSALVQEINTLIRKTPEEIRQLSIP